MFEFSEKNNQTVKKNCIKESIKISHSKLKEKLPKAHVTFYKNKKTCPQTCKKCDEDEKRGSFDKIFPNTESVSKHILRNHQSTKNYFPTFEQYFEVLEQIAITLEREESPESIPEVKAWGILIK